MNIDYFEIGKPVKVMDFIGIVVDITQDIDGLFLTLESPKRMALHQTTLDRLDFYAAPWSWEPATVLDLLQDAEK